MSSSSTSEHTLLVSVINCKDNRAAEGIIKAANFPFRKTLEDYDFSFQPSVSENQIRELSNLSFIEKHENIVFIGNPGVGKTHLAVSLGIEAARHRNSVYFITCHNLMLKLNKAQKENRLDKQLQHLAQYKVLFLRIKDLKQKWSKPIRNWKTIRLQLIELFGERYTKYLNI